MRLLLVEDNPQLSDWVAKTLRSDNYTVDCGYCHRPHTGHTPTERVLPRPLLDILSSSTYRSFLEQNMQAVF